jgi:uncharacterized membrane protein YhhN
MRKEPLTILYFLLGIIYIIAEYFNILIIEFISKPLLMPLLILNYYYLTNKFNLKKNYMLLAALFFSWIGDTTLLFERFTISFFLVGLLSFLIGQIFYIILFFKPLEGKPFSKLKAIIIIFIILYVVLFAKFLLPILNEFLLPVLFYSIIILTMLVTALNQQGKIEKEAFQYIFGGAVLFVISDSIIAINKFYIPFSLSTMGVMGFYLFAQYLIMKGIIIRDLNLNNN